MKLSNKQEKQLKDIVARVEKTRKGEGLSKSAFVRRLGMKPQTYNNFVGAQNTKPNAVLIHWGCASGSP